LYASSNIITVIRWRRLAEHLERMGAMKNVYNILVGKSELKRPLGRLKHRWEDNIRMDFMEIKCEGVDWIQLA
jgi:hypothetical protein